MKKLIYFLGVLIILVVGLFAALPFLISADFVEQQIVKAVKDSTGRTLRIGGGVRLSFFPSLSVKAGNVTLSNPPGMAEGDMLQTGMLKLSLKLIPLLSKRVEVDEFVLDRPIIALARDRQGRANWDFGTSASAGSAPAQGGETADSAAPAMLPEDIRLGDIRLVNGVLGYADAATGSQTIIRKINFSMQAPSLAGPLSAEGSLDWKGRTVSMSAQLQSISALLAQKATPLQMTISADGLDVAYDGSVTLASGVSAEGQVTAGTPSVRSLAAWLGAELPTPKGFGAFSMKTAMNFSNEVLSLNKLTLSLDGMKAEGGAQLRTTGVRPKLDATLAADTLNLNTYLNTGPAAAGPAPAKGDAGWSRTPIDVSGLGAVDADLRLSVAGLIYDKIKIGRGALSVSLDNRRIEIGLGELQLYEGRAQGKLVLNGRNKIPSFSARMTTTAVSALPLLTDAAGFKWISGHSALGFDLAGQGQSQYQMISTLNGKANMKFTDGAIEGINIAGMIRNLKKGSLSGWGKQPSAKTDFSEFSGSFTITNGVAVNDDLKLVGPLVRLSGDGNINILAQSVNYNAEPKLVASLKGQGGAGDKKGLTIPVKIKGPWSNPKITPDLKKLLQDPEALVENAKKLVKKVKSVKKIIKKLKIKDSKDLIGGLLGGKAEPSGDDDPVGGLLKNLLSQ